MIKLNSSIQKSLNVLYNISSLSLSDFTINDNIIKCIKDIPSNVLYTLGTEFDERINNSLIVLKSLYNDMIRIKKDSISIRSDLSNQKNINAFLMQFINIPGIDQYSMSYAGMHDAINTYFLDHDCNNGCCDISADMLGKNIEYLTLQKDIAYESSKQLVERIQERIEYNFSKNSYLLQDSCLEALNLILFLLKYYAEINYGFDVTIQYISNAIKNETDKFKLDTDR